MITLPVKITEREYVDLLNARKLLSRVVRTPVSDIEIEDCRKVFDRLQSGVVLSAMIAACAHHEVHHAHLPEVANG